jgi:hypothetical protein
MKNQLHSTGSIAPASTPNGPGDPTTRQPAAARAIASVRIGSPLDIDIA